MYRKILVPVDLSDHHAAVFELAVGLAAEGASLLLLHVIEAIEGADDRESAAFYALIEKRAEASLSRWSKQLASSVGGVEAAVRIGRRGPEIVRFAEESDCDLIVMASRTADPERPRGGFGTTSHQVALFSPCAVLLARGAAPTAPLRPRAARGTARELMTFPVRSVPAEMPLWELREFLLRERLRGAPVVDASGPVGWVSRSDVLRQEQLERSRFEAASAALEPFDSEAIGAEDEERIEQAVAHRLRTLRVRDAMSPSIESLPADAPISQVAASLLEKRLHRAVVVDGGEVVGVISTVDLIRALAESP